METVIKQNALIYARVSTEEQAREGYSLDAQEKFCKKFAELNKLKVLKTYRDEGKSATNLDRPALQELLTECQKNKEIGAVIVQETDRLARNTQDHLAIRAILRKAGVRLVSVAQPMLDESPEGKMVDTILASVNQFQSDLNGRKTKKGLQEKFDSGWWPGWAPLGYLNKRVNDRGIVAKDPATWPTLKEGFKLYLTGDYSALELSDILFEKGLVGKRGKKMANSIMLHILKNPFYAGIMRWNQKENQGKHEPMITLGEHQQILTIVDSHNQHASRRRLHNFLLRGFVFCGICNQRYTAEKHRTGKISDYYHCATQVVKHSNKGQNIESVKLERQVEERFRDIQFTQDFIDLVVQKVRQFYQERKGEKGLKKRALLNKQMQIEQKRVRAEEKLIAGTLQDEDFVRMLERYKRELQTLQNQIGELESQRDVDTETIRKVLMLSRNIYKAYKKARPEIKRMYLGFFWDKFLVQDRKIVKAEPTRLVKTLQNERKIIIRDNWLRR